MACPECPKWETGNPSPGWLEAQLTRQGRPQATGGPSWPCSPGIHQLLDVPSTGHTSSTHHPNPPVPEGCPV